MTMGSQHCENVTASDTEVHSDYTAFELFALHCHYPFKMNMCVIKLTSPCPFFSEFFSDYRLKMASVHIIT